MNYKIASKLCTVLSTMAVLCIAVLLIIGQVNTLFIIMLSAAVFLLALGLLTKFLFYRCPNCGQRLPMKSDDPSHCPNCGKMFH